MYILGEDIMFGYSKKNTLKEPATKWAIPLTDFSEKFFAAPVSFRLDSDDYFPQLEKHGLIPKNNIHGKSLSDDKENEKKITEAFLKFHRIPYRNENVVALQKNRREKEYEERSRSRKATTVNFLFQLYNQLKKQIDWNNQAIEVSGKSFPKLPKFSLDVVKIIASYFSFEEQIIKELNDLIDKSIVVTPRPTIKGVFFTPVAREKLQEQAPLIPTENNENLPKNKS